MHRFWILVLLMIALPLSATAAQQTVTLTVLWMTSPSDPPTLRDLLRGFARNFEAQTPGVAIDLQFVDWADGRQTLLDAAGSGTPPDLAVIGTRWVPEFVALGMIEPLDRYLSPAFRARFVDAIIQEGAVYQGRVFGLPVATSTRALFYNRALFTRAGITDAPATWDALYDAALAVSQLGQQSYGFGLQGGGGLETNTYFYYFVWGNGGDLYNSAQTASALNAPEAVEALAFLQRMVGDGATQPDPTDAAYERRRGVEDLFQRGTLGMVISGPWFINRLRQDAPDLDFGVAPLPYNTTPATYGVMDALTILRTSLHKDLAWAFLEFLYDDDRRLAYTTTAGVLPELKTLLDAPAFAQDPDYAVFLSLLPTARFESFNTQSESIAQVVIDAVTAVYRGDSDPRSALDAAAAQIDLLLQGATAGW